MSRRPVAAAAAVVVLARGSAWSGARSSHRHPCYRQPSGLATPLRGCCRSGVAGRPQEVGVSVSVGLDERGERCRLRSHSQSTGEGRHERQPPSAGHQKCHDGAPASSAHEGREVDETCGKQSVRVLSKYGTYTRSATGRAGGHAPPHIPLISWQLAPPKFIPLPGFLVPGGAFSLVVGQTPTTAVWLPISCPTSITWQRLGSP